MVAIDALRMRATALKGAPPPGDARAVAKVLSDLCDHVGMLENAVQELIRQTQQAQEEIADLKKLARRSD